jgi:serralysin
MANYLFEQMSDEDALGYDPATDSLFFLTGTASELEVRFNPAVGLSAASITLAMGGVSHTFAANALAGESFTFFEDSDDESTVAFGSNSAGDTVTVSGEEGFGARYYGFGGADSITGSEASDTVFGGDGNDTITGVSAAPDADGNVLDADYLNGGGGADTITGSDGNDHIWGNESTSQQGATDLGDLIDAGDGKDYVNGNAGNDTIDGGDGNDRLYGGAGDDTVDGGEGWDYLQGNKGNDVLDGEEGNDTVRGGAGNDTVTGGEGWDVLYGDAGADRFIFAAGDASDSNIGNLSTDPDAGEALNLVDMIMDFTPNSDIIDLPFNVTDILLTDDVAANSIEQAQAFANDLLDGGAAGNVAAIQVGSDTYLFYNDAGTAGADSNAVIQLVGVTADDLDVVATNIG